MATQTKQEKRKFAGIISWRWLKRVITEKVKIEIIAPTIITTVITKEAAEELNIKADDSVEAVIKATEVMVAK